MVRTVRVHESRASSIFDMAAGSLLLRVCLLVSLLTWTVQGLSLAGQLVGDSTNMDGARGVAVSRNYAYVAAYESGGPAESELVNKSNLTVAGKLKGA